MRRRGGSVLVGVIMGALLVAACGSDTETKARPRVTSTTRAKAATTTTSTKPARTTTTPRPTLPPTTTVEGRNSFIQSLLDDGKNATVKVIYDTPSGRVTLIRRDGNQVIADGSGVRFRINGSSYECTGSGTGAACVPIEGDATQSDADAYAGLVANALEDATLVSLSTSTLVGRTAECVTIVGPRAARAGRSVEACIDDQTGVLLRFETFGPPMPGSKLEAVAVGTPVDADFRIPVPPTGG
jgi:hypothetical protein